MAYLLLYNYIPIPLACAECSDSLPFSGASSILPYHILFPATLLRQLHVSAIIYSHLQGAPIYNKGHIQR